MAEPKSYDNALVKIFDSVQHNANTFFAITLAAARDELAAIINLLPAATKLGQGNIFTGVSLSTGGREGCLPQCMLGYTPPGADTPPHPPGADFSIRSTSGRYASYWNAFLFFFFSARSWSSWTSEVEVLKFIYS